MPKISIIIPVYNTEAYLCQCLGSVLGQSLTDIEIICVDDGSTDNSPQILDEYEAKDSRVKVLCGKRRGAAAARNEGLSAASGEYIGYVDSDDWIEPEMYEKLYRQAALYKADLVISGYFMEGAYTTVHLGSVSGGVYRDQELKCLREQAIYNLGAKEYGISGSLCCKLFRRELLEKVQLSLSDKLTFSEDKMCVLSYLLECGTVAVLKEAWYHYRIHSGSTVHMPRPDYLLSVHEVYQHFLKLYQHPRFTDTMRLQAELYIIEMLEKGINTRMGFQYRNLLWIDPYWLEHIPSWAGVVLYGAGELGEKYRRQLCAAKDRTYVTCVDFGYDRFADSSYPVEPPEALAKLDYDYIVITIKNPAKATEIRTRLLELGIADSKVLWFEQREQFWKYAQADGLLDQ